MRAITQRVLNQPGSVVFAVVVLAIALTSLFIHRTEAAQPQRRAGKSRTQKIKVPPKPKVNYSAFSHRTHVVSQKLACNSCHKVPSRNWKDFRKGDAAFPDVSDFPEHSACLTCHPEKFLARERPAKQICTNCNIAMSTRDTARWLFPSLENLTRL